MNSTSSLSLKTVATLARAWRALLVAGVLCACTYLQAAEIQLRNECRSENPLVTLGDMAAIYTDNPTERQTLEAIEIGPTPSVGSRRYVGIREIQEILRARGVNILEHRFSGAARVMVRAGSDSNPSADQRPLSSSAVLSATRAVRQAIENLLTRQDPAGGPWIIDVKLDDAQSRAVMDERRAVTVVGGQAPWDGNQYFEVTVGPANAARRFSIEAAVSRPPEVVVAVRTLPRGVRIAPADVRLQSMPETGYVKAPCSSLEQVIGKETTRAIAANKLIDLAMIRAPLLVRRGEMIKVISEGGGICVTVTAKAQGEGGLGDLVTVETLDRKNTYQAQVSGPQQARVFPVAVQTRPTASLGSRSSDVRPLQYRDRSWQ